MGTNPPTGQEPAPTPDTPFAFMLLASISRSIDNVPDDRFDEHGECPWEDASDLVRTFRPPGADARAALAQEAVRSPEVFRPYDVVRWYPCFDPVGYDNTETLDWQSLRPGQRMSLRVGFRLGEPVLTERVKELTEWHLKNCADRLRRKGGPGETAGTPGTS